MRAPNVLIALAVVLLIAGVWTLWPRGDRASETREAKVEPTSVASATASARQTAAARTAVAAPTPAAGTDEQAAVLRGRVRDGNGQRLANIAVVYGNPANWEALHSPTAFSMHSEFATQVAQRDGAFFAGMVAHTDEAGEFAFTHVPDSAPRALAALAKDGSFVLRPVVAGERGPIELVLATLDRIVGTVRDERGEPVAAALVQAYSAGATVPAAEVTSGQDGQFTTPRLAGGTYAVSASTVRHDEVEHPPVVLAATGRDVTADLRLRRRRELTCRAVDEVGNPWTAERIRASTPYAPADLAFLATHTGFATRHELEMSVEPAVQLEHEGSTGRLLGFARTPPSRTLSVWRGRDKLAEARMPPDGSGGDVVLKLAHPPITLAVELTFEPGAPPPETLLLVGQEPTEGEVTVLTRNTTVDDRTEMVIPPVNEALVVASAAGFDPAQATVHAPPGTPRITVRLRLTRGTQRVRGRIVDSAGRGIVNALVAAADPFAVRWALRVPRTTTAVDGSFTLEGLRAPPWRLFATAPDLAARAFAIDAASETPQSFTLNTGHLVEVFAPVDGICLRMLDAAGGPVGDDRLMGTQRHGSPIRVRVDASVALLLAMRPNGTAIGRGMLVTDRIIFKP